MIAPGQTLKFNVTSTYDPKKMFAGVYTLKLVNALFLDSQDSFFNVSISSGEKVSAPIAVVGEQSPYINNIVADLAANQIIVTGQRFGSSVVAKINDISSKVMTQTSSRIIIPLAGYNISPNTQYLVVVSNVNGASNGYGFNTNTEPMSTSTLIRQ